MSDDDDRDFEDDDGPDDGPDAECRQCDGQGCVAVDWDFLPVRLDLAPPYLRIAKCPNCGGSGLAKDCTYW